MPIPDRSITTVPGPLPGQLTGPERLTSLALVQEIGKKNQKGPCDWLHLP